MSDRIDIDQPDAIIGERPDVPAAPYAAEEHGRAIASTVREVDALRSERDEWRTLAEKAIRQRELVNADYADLKVGFEGLGAENTALKAELAAALEALEDIDARLDVALGKPTSVSGPRPVARPAPQPRPDNPLVSPLTSPITRKLAGQLLKAVMNSTRPDPAEVDRRAGGVEGTPPLPARHPDSAPEVEHPAGPGPDAPSGAGEGGVD